MIFRALFVIHVFASVAVVALIGRTAPPDERLLAEDTDLDGLLVAQSSVAPPTLVAEDEPSVEGLPHVSASTPIAAETVD